MSTPVNPKMLAKMLERQSLIEQAQKEDEIIKENLRKSNSKEIDKVLKKITKEKDTLPVKDIQEFFGAVTAPQPVPPPEPFKPKPIRVVRGEPKNINGKIVQNKMELQKDPIIVNDDFYEEIGKPFGAENFFDAMNPNGYPNGNPTPTNNVNTSADPFLNLDKRLPDYNGEIMVEIGNTFTNQNKDLMQQQMNVVALYSIKDAKPFYYVSSAEARMAIEYINEARTYKKDIHKFRKETNEIINSYINDDYNFQEIEVNKAPLNYKEIFSKDLVENLPDNVMPPIYDEITSIQKIETRMLYPMTIKNTTINNIEVLVKLSKDILFTPFITIIDLHENITGTFGNYSSIIVGNDFMNFMGEELIAQQRYIRKCTENTYGIIATYSGKNGHKNIFYKPVISKGFIVLSRNLSNNTQTMYRYLIVT